MDTVSLKMYFKTIISKVVGKIAFTNLSFWFSRGQSKGVDVQVKSSVRTSLASPGSEKVKVVRQVIDHITFLCLTGQKKIWALHYILYMPL